jgi:hypothetical protein
MSGSGTATPVTPSVLATFQDQMTLDLADFYENSGFATTVTHTTIAGVSKSILALIKYGRDNSYQGADDYAVDATARIQAQGTDGVATIAQGETITIGTGTWIVIDANKSASGLEWVCSISKKR